MTAMVPTAAVFLALDGLILLLGPRGVAYRPTPLTPPALLGWIGAVAVAGLLLPAAVLVGPHRSAARTRSRWSWHRSSGRPTWWS